MINRLLSFVVLVLVALLMSLSLGNTQILSSVAQISPVNTIQSQELRAVELEKKAKELYSMGEFAKAITIWQQEANNQKNVISRARLLSNIALAYQQLGQGSEANKTISNSLNLLTSQSAIMATTDRLAVLAQAFNTKGILQLSQGQLEQAIETWQEAIDTYTKVVDKTGILRSQINQAQALQALGLYRRVVKILTQVNQAAEINANLNLKSASLRILGNTLRLIGDLKQSEQVLQESLAIAQQLQSSEDIATALLGLGKIANAQGNRATALTNYQKAANIATSTATKVQIQLAQLSLLIDTQQWEAAVNLSQNLVSNLSQLPLSHTKIFNQINFARSLTRLQQSKAIKGKYRINALSWTDIAQLLENTVAEAQNLGDRQAESYAQGLLGGIYEINQQWAIARDLTKQALLIAQTINKPEITYRWQWQLGRIFAAQNQNEKAILTYSEAVKTLQSIRSDLVFSNAEIQFSFREGVEPVYRELVDLLLKPAPHQAEINQERLRQARDVIESLQLAELDNFFREACLEAKPKKIDDVDPQAAVIYPIILRDRLAIILSLPKQPLRYYSTSISHEKLENTIAQLRYTLVIRSRRDFFKPAKDLYDWLIAPIEADLVQKGIKTLVFVLDGSLRNIPMATLSDGKHFLIEKYRIALTPGLQLLEPQPLQQIQLKTLAAGLTKERSGLSPLNYVSEELQEIQTKISTLVLLNEKFTTKALREELKFSDFPIVHIATHGQFSSNIEKTFIVAWDSPINITQLDNLLQSGISRREKALELLVLSACETASGDQRAALGLAGIAVRAGARSTAATLWAVNDQATAKLMGKFYRGLATGQITKAEALRQAQLTLLKNRWYKHPFYWAPYVLVGNWL